MHGKAANQSVQQFISATRKLTADRSGVDHTDLPGIAVCWMESPILFWNAIFFTEHLSTATGLHERLSEAARYMRSKRESGVAYLCLDLISGGAHSELDKVLGAVGLEQVFAAKGMSCTLPIGIAEASALTFQRATAEETMMHFADMNSMANHFPREAFRAGIRDSAFWKQEAYAFVGYLRGEPVCCAAAIENDGALYVSLVSTAPAMQGRGFGSAVVRYALAETARLTGVTRSVLHASTAGVSVYERLGFGESARFIALGLSTAAKA